MKVQDVAGRSPAILPAASTRGESALVRNATALSMVCGGNSLQEKPSLVIAIKLRTGMLGLVAMKSIPFSEIIGE